MHKNAFAVTSTIAGFSPPITESGDIFNIQE